MNLPLIRPARIDDLATLVHFALEGGFGITSLPRAQLALEQKLQLSQLSFESEKEIPIHEVYQFCLEFEGRVVGTSQITSRVGLENPFFALHLIQEPLNCPYLGIKRHTKVLHFVRARKKPTELGSLFLTADMRGRGFGPLLSFSRLLFMAYFKKLFASFVIAELRGINIEGYSPFWEAVGRPFFNLDFPKADLLRVEHYDCIEELFPKHPLYVDLLPKEAQNAIEMPHPHTVPAKKLLEKQGFCRSGYIDIFDGGPHVYALLDEIKAVKESKVGIVHEISDKVLSAPALLALPSLDFRATQASIHVEQDRITLCKEAADLLKVRKGDALIYYVL